MEKTTKHMLCLQQCKLFRHKNKDWKGISKNEISIDA